MNKLQLTDALAQKAGMTKVDAAKAVNASSEVIGDAHAAGEDVKVTGFGAFEVKTRGARKGINPRTKEEITIEASKLPSFKAGKALKDVIAK